MSDSMQNFRDQIDDIDSQMMELLGRRIRIVEKVGDYKREHNLQSLDTERWVQLMEVRLAKARELGLSEEFVHNFYETLHEYTLQVEQDKGAQ